MQQNDIGKFIAQCRKEKNLTQAELAKELGVSDKSISRWENGKTMMDMSLYEPLCQILDIEISELLYAKKLSPSDKTAQGEKSALRIFVTKSRLETLAIFTEILIFVGIVIAITLTGILASSFLEKIITLTCGCFVWGFGLILRVFIRKMILSLEADTSCL